MMELWIDAHDLSWITLGLSAPNRLMIQETLKTNPERYLETLDAFLKKHSLSFKEIQQMIVVPGPGSFTASRVSVTIANALAFVLNIPIRTPNGQPQSFIVPVYNKPPHIH